jgi:O-antigen ligase/tetratricopeptide (TPR) repeat protein
MTFNKALRWIIVAGVFAVPFIPLIVSRTMFFPFITGKNFTFRIIIEIIFAAWIILALRDRTYRPRFSWICVSLASFVGVIALADIFGINLYKSFWSNYERMEGFLALIHLFAFFVVAGAVLNTKQWWERLFYTSVGASIFIGLYGFLQLGGELVINQGGVRVDATFGNATYLAIYMIFHIFITAFLAWRHQFIQNRGILASYLIGSGLFLLHAIKRVADHNLSSPGTLGKWLILLSLVLAGFAIFLWLKRQWFDRRLIHYSLYAAVIILQISILYHTATRGAILGFIGGALLTAVLIVFFERKHRAIRKVSIVVLTGVILLTGGFFLVRKSEFVMRSPVLSRLASISVKSETASRFPVWNAAYQGFKERPVLGWGQGNFDVVFNKYYDPRMYSQESWFDRAHNIVFDWLIAGGLLGLLGYISIFISTIYLLWRDRAQKFSFVEKALFTGLLASYAFHNLFVFDNITSYILFFAVLGYIHTTESQPFKNTLWSKIIPSEGVVNRIITPFTVITLVLVVYSFNVKGILASQALIRAISSHEEGPRVNLEYFKKALSYDSFGTPEIREQLIQMAFRAQSAPADQKEVAQEFYELARNEMRRQTEEAPNSARYHYFLGALLRSFGQYDESLEALKQALALSPHKQQIQFVIGSIYLDKGERKQALEVFRKAFEGAPENQEARLLYAIAAIYAGDNDLVEKLLVPEFGTVLIPEDRFVRAYSDTGQNDKVLAIWKIRAEKLPNNPQVHLSLGASYLQMGQREEAIKEIEQVIELEPSFKEQGEYYIREIRAGRNP